MSKRRGVTANSESPILTWPGKRPPEPRSPCVAQLVEWFAPNQQTPPATAAAPFDIGNALFLGDNRDALTYLLDHGMGGQVKLIYIDPPFHTGNTHRRKVRLRIPKAPTMQTSADAIIGASAQYDDRWAEGAYLQFIYDRLPLLRDLLAEEGTLWLHCDHRQAHHLRVLIQEVFGASNYLNTVIWRSQVARGAKVNAFYFPYSAQYLEIFAKNRRAATTWNPPKKQLVMSEAAAARAYMRDERGFFRTSDPGTYTFASLKSLHAEGRLYAPYGGEIIVDEATQRIYPSKGGNLGIKYYLTDLGPVGQPGKWAVERAVDNLWDDIPGLGITPGEDLGYPTQKTEALLARIIRTATNPGDLVFDCFMGSGTTLAVAQQLGRRWIGSDNSLGALHTTRRRLQALANRDPNRATSFAVFRMDGTVNETNTASPPLQASVRIVRNSNIPASIEIEIVEVHSPALAQLTTEASHADLIRGAGWRAVVDSVAIDPSHDGRVFRSVVVDAPRKKGAQVSGHYQFAAPAEPTVVAVRITDLLGGEAICTAQV